VRGPAGGFELQQPATEISVLQIYEAIEGKIKLAACPLGKEVCAFRSCIFSSELSRISAEIYAAYQSIKLSEM
jgi:DNA-binding IscR family transcriptional regulator